MNIEENLSGQSSINEDSFEIELNHGDNIIGINMEISNRIHLIDLMLNALQITYRGKIPVILKRIHFTLLNDGSPLHELVLKERLLEEEICGVYQYITSNKDNPNHLKVVFGSDNFFKIRQLTSEINLESGQSIGIINKHFSLQTGEKVDALEISVLGKTLDDKFLYSSQVFKYNVYKNRQKLLFPLGGTWLSCNNFDYIYAHRRCWSQEFALDFVQLSIDGKLFKGQEPGLNENWACYGQDVYAPADGVVVDIVDGIPDNPGGFASRLPGNQLEEIYKQRGFKAVMAGNYIVLDHGQAEFSFLAHLQPFSLTVELNDKVKAGQLLGRIGNSGNSDAAHLHFQLMNGPDFLTAKGLPMVFNNLTDISGAPVSFIYPNNSIISTSGEKKPKKNS
ncbi:M23 family metallopeptidase [bacterium]|nr:M23 family metallopeptidase [bacterium]